MIALIVWLATAKAIGGKITVDTLSDQWVSFAGNAAAIVSGGVLSIGLSLWRPANFDWEITRSMSVIKESTTDLAQTDPTKEKEEEGYNNTGDSTPSQDGESGSFPPNIDGLDMHALERTYKTYGLIFSALGLVITFVSLTKTQLFYSLQHHADYPCTIGCRTLRLFPPFLCRSCGDHVCELMCANRSHRIGV